MRILITGGTSPLGLQTTRELLDQNHQVVIVDRLTTARRQDLDRRAVFFEGSVADVPFLMRIFADHFIDAVLHLSAPQGVDEKSALAPYRRVFADGLAVLEAVGKAGLRKLVMVTPPTEGSEVAAQALHASHQLLEAAVSDLARQEQLGAIVLRLPVVAGLKPLAEADMRDAVHARDLARLHVAALKQVRPGETSVYDFAQASDVEDLRADLGWAPQEENLSEMIWPHETNLASAQEEDVTRSSVDPVLKKFFAASRSDWTWSDFQGEV